MESSEIQVVEDNQEPRESDNDVDSDGELMFDPVKDMWVTVEVVRDKDMTRGDDTQYWVWEVRDTYRVSNIS